MSPQTEQFRLGDVQRIIALLREHMASYGYVPAEAPLIQPAELFLTRAGDQIIHKLFTFERHGVALALRPEFTSPALRRYVEEQAEGRGASQVARWQFSGVIFEDDPASNRMNYERWSVGAECIGLPGVGGDAEVIAMAAAGVEAVGLSVRRVVLGSLQLVRRLLAAYELDTRVTQFLLTHLSALRDPALGVDYVLSRFDLALASTGSDPLGAGAEVDAQRAFELVLDSTERGATMGGRTQADIARRLLQKHRRAAQREHIREALKALERLAQIDAPPHEAIAELLAYRLQDEAWTHTLDQLQAVAELLPAYGIDAQALVMRPGLVRDWEYYSGMVFELYTADERHVAGGGRYDEFARLIGSSVDVPAVGFVYYIDQLADRAPSSGASLVWPLVASADDVQAVRWAAVLRAEGVPVMIVSEVPADVPALRLDPGGDLRFVDTLYTLDQLETLIVHLDERRS